MIFPLGLIIFPGILIFIAVIVSLVARIPPIRRVLVESQSMLVVVALILGMVSFLISFVLLSVTAAWIDHAFSSVPFEDPYEVDLLSWLPWVGIVPGVVSILIVWFWNRKNLQEVEVDAAV